MKNILFFLSIMCVGQIHGQIITTIAGNGAFGFTGDGGQALNASMASPVRINTDTAGNIYISDWNNGAVRKIDITGVITTVAGNGTNGFSGDGAQAINAKLFHPDGTDFDSLGNMYVSDRANNRIRKVDISGVISTIAGDSVAGYNGDGIPANSCELSAPSGVAIDKKGNIFIADASNHRIRMIDTAGIIHTVAGIATGGYSGDGGLAINAALNGPTSIVVDNKGNIYFGDYANYRVRKINSSGIISTIAGTGIPGYYGNGISGTMAKLNGPTGLAIDKMGSVYFADQQNNVIRKIDTSGIITTIAGDTIAGYSGDGGLAINAQLYGPAGVFVDTALNVYIADTYNNRVRKILYSIGILENKNPSLIINIYPNPTSDQFFVDANTADKLNVDLYDVNGRHVFSKIVNDKENISVATLDNGIYTLTIKTTDRAINKKLVIVR